VQYLLQAADETIGPLRKLLASIGDSVAVIGGDGLWRVHVHTDEGERAIGMGEAFGETSDVEVVSFAEQIEQTNRSARAAQESEAAQSHEAPANEPVAGTSNVPEQPATTAETPGIRGIPLAEARRPASLVAVVSGSGIAKLFGDLGAIIVEGAARGAVSDEALLQAIDSAPMPDVIVLPNHEDIFWRLVELKAKTKKSVTVVRTVDIAEGLSAAVAYSDARDLNQAVQDMEAALAHVRTGVVAVARIAGDSPAGPIASGQSVGIAEGSIVEVADDPVAAASSVGKALLEGDRELLTVIYADDVSDQERDRLRQALADALNYATVELHPGGQPIHRYILAAE
jgi:hypothetical protein